MAQLFSKGDKLLKEQMDKTVLALKAAYPKFVEAYFSIREIVDPATHTTAFDGVVRSAETKQPVPASVEIAELHVKTQTDMEGHFEFKPVKHGVYTIKVKAEGPGYMPKIISQVTIKLGRTTHLNIALQPV